MGPQKLTLQARPKSVKLALPAVGTISTEGIGEARRHILIEVEPFREMGASMAQYGNLILDYGIKFGVVRRV